MTAVDMCALHPAELLTLTGSKGWMDLCTTQVALGFTKQCAAFFEKCAVPEGTTSPSRSTSRRRSREGTSKVKAPMSACSRLRL